MDPAYLAALSPLGALAAAWTVRAGHFCLSASLRASWRDQRRLEWLERDLPDPCLIVGHDPGDDFARTCNWCDHADRVQVEACRLGVGVRDGCPWSVELRGETYWVRGDAVKGLGRPHATWPTYKRTKAWVESDARLCRPGTNPYDLDDLWVTQRATTAGKILVNKDRG